LSRLEEQQSLKVLEDIILDSLNAIKGSLLTASRQLKRSYQSKPETTAASEWLEENIAELEHLHDQAANLLKKAQGARALVSRAEFRLFSSSAIDRIRSRIFSNLIMAMHFKS
jgi:hypothetical protein